VRRILVTARPATSAGPRSRSSPRTASRRSGWTSSPRRTPAPDGFVTGPVDDPDAVREAIGGCDAVIHLAAIPAPTLGTPEEVFVATRCHVHVLNTAGRAGIGRR